MQRVSGEDYRETLQNYCPSIYSYVTDIFLGYRLVCLF